MATRHQHIGQVFLGDVVREFGHNRILISERKQQRQLAAEIGAHEIEWFEGIASSGGLSYPESARGRFQQDIGPTVFNLSTIRIPSQNIPILYNHEDNPSGQLGRATGIYNDESSIAVQGILFKDKSKTRDVIARATASRDHRFYLSMSGGDFHSIQIERGQPVVVNERVMYGPFTLVESFQLEEISFVEEPADSGTYARILSRRDRFQLIAKRKADHQLTLRFRRSR